MVVRRGAVAIAVATMWWPAQAGADPPGPTDYRTEVVAVTPATDAISVGVVGGDAFLTLTVEHGVEVEVVGYRGEPYLRFGADGSVFENRRSPTYAANRSRYGADVPAELTPRSTPEWVSVAGDGSYAWHDHRAHWMSTSRPPARQPGDVVLEAVVPVTVDGTATSIRIRSTWLPRPSRWPPVLGAAVGAAAALVTLRSRRRSAAVLAVVAAAAATAGWWRYSSVPAETGPSALMWALPSIAAVAALASLRLAGRIVDAFALLAGLELALWSWQGAGGLGRAIVPTDAPGWFDRAVVGGVAAVAVIVTVDRTMALVGAAPSGSSDGGSGTRAATRATS
jgi:hypothetical protein